MLWNFFLHSSNLASHRKDVKDAKVATLKSSEKLSLAILGGFKEDEKQIASTFKSVKTIRETTNYLIQAAIAAAAEADKDKIDALINAYGSLDELYSKMDSIKIAMSSAMEMLASEERKFASDLIQQIAMINAEFASHTEKQIGEDIKTDGVRTIQ